MALPQPQLDASLPLVSWRRSVSWMQIVQVISVLIFLALATLRFLVAPLDRFDEGVTLTKAALVAAGQVPFRDFWATYGPLDSYLLAAAFKLFAANVVVERVMGALLVPAIGVVAYALMRYIRLQAGLRLLLTGLIAMVPLAVPAFNNAFLANAIGLAAVLVFLYSLDRGGRRWPLSSGALVGLASFTRPEFAVALGAGLLIGYTVLVLRRQTTVLGQVAPYLAGGVLTAAVLWLPVVLQAGIGPVWFDLVTYALDLYPRARSIPFGRGDEAAVVLVFSVAFAVVWLWAGTHAYRQRADARELARLIGLLSSAVLLFTWVRTRADGIHAFDAWPLTAVVLALLLARRPASRRPASARLQAVVAVTGILLFSVGAGGLALRDLLRPHFAAGVPRSGISGERAWMPAPALAELIQAIDAAVPTGQPVWVGLRRNDLVTFNDTMLYFLSDRQPGTVDYEALPGLTNTEATERQIACQLSSRQVTLAVLGPNSGGEPWNLSSLPGSTFLDQWIAERAVSRTQIGPYELVRLRPGRQLDAFPCLS
jgi:hypothetical protein